MVITFHDVSIILCALNSMSFHVKPHFLTVDIFSQVTTVQGVPQAVLNAQRDISAPLPHKQHVEPPSIAVQEPHLVAIVQRGTSALARPPPPPFSVWPGLTQGPLLHPVPPVTKDTSVHWMEPLPQRPVGMELMLPLLAPLHAHPVLQVCFMYTSSYVSTLYK